VLSESIQDYLKSVYKLQTASGRVTIGALARDQGVSPASASAMVKKLAADRGG
jgi:Mn-dependent DtxR family transcriptional regulator